MSPFMDLAWGVTCVTPHAKPMNGDMKCHKLFAYIRDPQLYQWSGDRQLHWGQLSLP